MPIPIAMAAMTPITTSLLIFFSLMTLLARFRRSFGFILVEPQQMMHAFIVYMFLSSDVKRVYKKWQ
jgi:hypothetical protein